MYSCTLKTNNINKIQNEFVIISFLFCFTLILLSGVATSARPAARAPLVAPALSPR